MVTSEDIELLLESGRNKLIAEILNRKNMILSLRSETLTDGKRISDLEFKIEGYKKNIDNLESENKKFRNIINDITEQATHYHEISTECNNITKPKDSRSVLAKIEHQNDRGLSSWFEVVSYNGNDWCSFAGSKTFEDGEQVTAWIYADTLFI